MRMTLFTSHDTKTHFHWRQQSLRHKLKRISRKCCTKKLPISFTNLPAFSNFLTLLNKTLLKKTNLKPCLNQYKTKTTERNNKNKKTQSILDNDVTSIKFKIAIMILAHNWTESKLKSWTVAKRFLQPAAFGVYVLANCPHRWCQHLAARLE